MELPDSFLQPLLLLLGEDVCELIASFQESIKHPLIQLAEELLHRGESSYNAGWNKSHHHQTCSYL
jgi:hypothetical protein